jgi:hypothetical protein
VVLLGYGRKSFEINAHAFNNASNPPFTRLSSDNFILSVPDGAQMEAATVSAPDGGTTKLALFPIPGQSGKYRIDFPMKPGLTKYAINYQVPYDGKLVFNRRAQYPMKQIGIILPASMHFRSIGGKLFHADVGQPGTHEQVLDNIGMDEPFAFEVSGAGFLAHYLRPLKPGESPMPARSNALNAPWLHSGLPVPHASSPQSRSGFAGYPGTLAAGVLVFAGILLWSMKRRKILEM